MSCILDHVDPQLAGEVHAEGNTVVQTQAQASVRGS
jgi:hypothetical protein